MKTVLTNNPAGLNTRKRLSFLLKDSALYGGAAAVSKAFALITFPLLAQYFSVEEYGILDYFMVLGGLLAIFFIFGQDSAVARYFYELEETDIRRQLISQSFLFQLFGLIILLPLLWLESEWLTGIMIEAPDRVRIFRIVLFQLPFMMLINFSQNLLKWTFARSHFLMVSLGFTIVHTSLLVVALIFFDVGVFEVLLVSLFTTMVFGLLGLFWVRKWLLLPKNFSHLREMLPYALPYGIICLVGAFSPTLERTLTNTFLGTQALGLYAVGTKIAMLMGLLVSAFQTAWGPFSLSIHKQADACDTYNWVLKLFAFGMCLAVLMLTLLSQPLILLLATERYKGASIVVFPLAMGLVIQATSWITEIGISISKQAHLNLYSYALALLFSLSGIFLLTPDYGLLGVGLSVLLGNIAKALLSSWLAQRAYALPWDYTPVIILITVTMVSGFASIWMSNQFGVVVCNLMLVTSMLLIIFLGWFVLLSQVERSKVEEFMARRSVVEKNNTF